MVEVSADGQARGVNTMVYTTREIERVARVGFEVARKRRRRLASVDKANVLVSQLWRDVVTRVAKDYPDITLEHVLVDNCAMALVQRPTQFDTIVTENTFGDILSDEAAILAGSMGMLPSASLGGSVGLYEPVHGTAPDIAGQGSRIRSRRSCRARCCCGTRSTDPRMPIGWKRRSSGCSSRAIVRGHRGGGHAGRRHARDGRHDREGAGGAVLMATGLGIAVVGATGAAGQTTLRILEERKFPVRELRCFASERSVGKTVAFRGEAIPIRRVEAAGQRARCRLLLGGLGAGEGLVPMVRRTGAIVIDKSSAFRLDPSVPLVVPEINAHAPEVIRASWPCPTARPSSPSCR